jgi:hypothetical protein
MIPPLQLKVNIHYNRERGSGKIRVNDEVDVTQPDIVVQDGVIHKIDDIIFPPKLSVSTTEDGEDSISIWDKIKVKLFGAKTMLTVEDIMERFQPYLDQTL